MTDDSAIDRREHGLEQAVPHRGASTMPCDMSDISVLVDVMIAGSRTMHAAKDASTVLDVLVKTAGDMTGGACRLSAEPGPASGSHPTFSLHNHTSPPALHLEIDVEMSMRVHGMMSILCGQAGVMLDQLAMQDASVREVSARQVAEFQSARLIHSFEQRLNSQLAERTLWADVFRNSQYGVCIVGHDLRYVSFNPAFTGWFTSHHEIEPYVGQPIMEALERHPTLARHAIDNWRRALAGEDFTHVWHMGNDALHHYETRYAALRDECSNVTAAVQFSLEITDRVLERKRLEVAEHALRQSQKMEAVGKLTGGIAHDFNNILTGIVGSLDIISRRIAEGRSDGVARYLEMASISANRAASLTHRLLAFSRRQPVDPRLTDVDALIHGMTEMLSRTMGPDIAMSTTTSGSSRRVLCDPSQLENALLNLAMNAREAMPNGGRLLIASTIVKCDEVPLDTERHDGEYMRITVSDTGDGMTPEVLNQAIEPFFTTKGIGHGTGLGLSMVYGFARQSGGYLDLASRRGEGTTVTIYLPSTAAEAPEVQPRDVQVREIQDTTVLVVEDEPAVRMLVVEMLEEMGCTVIEAEDGGKGASLLSSDIEIDLLVTDIGLPVLNGRQVATVGRSSRPNLPILFMTGYAENATITEGFGDRTTLVTKPFRPGQIAEAVERMLA